MAKARSKKVPVRRVSPEAAMMIGRLRGHLSAIEREVDALDKIGGQLDPTLFTQSMLDEVRRSTATAWGDTVAMVASTRRALLAITGQ